MKECLYYELATVPVSGLAAERSEGVFHMPSAEEPDLLAK